jgi:hypothetical protein
LPLLSIVWLFQGSTQKALIGIFLFLVAMVTIFFLAPWRFPKTKYWLIMLPPLVIFFVSVAVSIKLWGGFEKAGLRPAELLVLSVISF